MASQESYSFHVNYNYIKELQLKYPKLKFTRIENTGGKYITNPENRDFENDRRIFAETMLKRYFMAWCARPGHYELLYFSKHESENDIYKLDSPKCVQVDEKYAIQNVGHSTQLIHLPNCTILTDPIFGKLCWILYPEKTKSHPKIQNLPRIDVILISHNHRDHMDEKSLRDILAHHKDKGWSAPQVFVPMGDKKSLLRFGFSQVEEVEWFTKISIMKNDNLVSFISIPADHRSGRFLTDSHKSLVVGWVINDEQNDVIFKYSGDTRSLSDENQKAIDALLWNEVRNKDVNKDKVDEDVVISDIICFEPSGPNYTRCDMDVTHQSSSYSALLKFIEAENIAKLSGQNASEILKKIQTVMIHHNKFELGPDRFNEGLFVLKKLVIYLFLNQEDLYKELEKQNLKLENELDRKAIRQKVPLYFRLYLLWFLQKQTSMFVHSKSFIIEDILNIMQKLESFDNVNLRGFLIEYLQRNTKFLKIGERRNDTELSNLKVNIRSINKYKFKKSD